MISILISSYNQDPSIFIKDLCSQIGQSDERAEIIIGNDCSDSKFMPFYKELEKLQYVSLFSSEQNLGRSKIRNKLAQEANFPFLLFIDGDAEVLNNNFLEKYFESASQGTVICGGTAYHETPPAEVDNILRWKYGIHREAKKAEQRNSDSYSSFSSFNFLIHADDFRENSFDESIIRYGHEDTIFGIELKKNDIRVKHVDNQLIHAGLEPAELFLKKTHEGLLNLKSLENSYKDKESLYEHIRILRIHKSLRKSGLNYVLSIIRMTLLRAIKRNLTGHSPSLRLFDLYKLILINDIKD